MLNWSIICTVLHNPVELFDPMPAALQVYYVATFSYINVDLTHHICRLKLLAEKISDPHRPVCPGAATRLEVCMLIGVLKSQQTITEVCTSVVVDAVR